MGLEEVKEGSVRSTGAGHVHSVPPAHALRGGWLSRAHSRIAVHISSTQPRILVEGGSCLSHFAETLCVYDAGRVGQQ